MANVTSASARPIQGVSQQPEKTRNEGQCTLQDNMSPSVVDGLKKRTGTFNIDLILTSLGDNAKVHHYRRGTGEEYFIIFDESAGAPRIFGIDGVEHIVNVTSGALYCTDTDPDSNLSLHTISDFTFIVNKTVPVEMRAELSPVLVNEAMVYTQFATYGRDYQVWVDGIMAGQYQTPDGDVAEHIDEVDTTYVTAQLYSGEVWTNTSSDEIVLEQAPAGSHIYDIEIPAASQVQFVVRNDTQVVVTIDSEEVIGSIRKLTLSGITDGVSVRAYYQVPATGGLSTLLPTHDIVLTDNTIHIKRKDGAAFTLRTVDGADGKDLIAVTDYVTKVSDLPPKAPEGFMTEIREGGAVKSTSYWLQAEGAAGSTTKWIERVAPETQLGYNLSTMPVTLIRQSVDGFGVATFELVEGDWADRAAGDEDSNPVSAFVYEAAPTAINSIGVIQNRLYFTSGESVCLSEGDGNFFNFFRPSAQVAADTDPLDVFADSEQINNLEHGILLDGDLAFFSEQAQFLLKGDKPLTKAVATLRQISGYENNLAAKPVPAGENIFFAYTSGDFTGIREFFTDSITDTKRANPVTEHVDEYIIGRTRSLETSTNQNWLFVLTDDDRNVIYVYNWLWLGDQKVQSAWHRWVWPEDEEIVKVVFSQDKLYMLIKRSEGIFLEYLPIGDPSDHGTASAESPQGFPVRLDRKYTATATFMTTHWEFPDILPDEDIDNLEVVRATGCYDEDIGATVIFERVGDKLVTHDDLSDKGTCSLIVGKKFLSEYEPTLPVVKDYRDRVVGVDKLTVSRMFLNYEDTGFVKVRVTDRWRNFREYEFSGRILGSFTNIVGFAPLRDGQHTFPVHQRAEAVTVNISTDSYLPFQLRDLEWSGSFHQRARRI